MKAGVLMRRQRKSLLLALPREQVLGQSVLLLLILKYSLQLVAVALQETDLLLQIISEF